MSTNASPLLATVSQQVVIYMGSFLVITGFIGGVLNIIVFSSLKTFRQSSCAFYLTIMSVVNTIHLFTGLLTYIMINGFGINWTNMSLFYCKFRALYIQVCLLISLTCMCLATIDQFLATCANPRWHRWNNIKTARYIVIGVVIVWVLYGIPFLVYTNHVVSPITGISTCVMTNVVFQKYLTTFHAFVLSTSIPLAVMVLFGALAYRNVRQIAYRTVPLVQRELDKQLTNMVLIQAFLDVLLVTPAIPVNAYNIISGIPSDPFTQLVLRLINTVEAIWYYFYFASPFYIYVCASKRFRQQLTYVMFTVHLNRCRGRRMADNQVEPQP